MLAHFSVVYGCRLARTNAVDDGKNLVATLCKDLTALTAMEALKEKLTTSEPGDLPTLLAPFKKVTGPATVAVTDLVPMFLVDAAGSQNTTTAIVGANTAQQRAVAAKSAIFRRGPRRPNPATGDTRALVTLPSGPGGGSGGNISSSVAYADIAAVAERAFSELEN